MGFTVRINAGDALVPDATIAQAWFVLGAFIAAAGLDRPETVVAIAHVPHPLYEQGHAPLGRGGGRFLFRLARDGRTVELAVPGAPLGQVKPGKFGGILDAAGETLHRLYVNGESWWWETAIAETVAALGGQG